MLQEVEVPNRPDMLLSGDMQALDGMQVINTGGHRKFLAGLHDIGLPVHHIDLVDETYEFAKSAHRGQVRDGEVDEQGKPLRYFEHPRAVANILTEELREYLVPLEANTIACLVMAALLHDVPEDTSAMGNRQIRVPGDRRSWREVVRDRLQSWDPWRRFPGTAVHESSALIRENLGEVVLGVTKLDKSELAVLGISESHPNFDRLKVQLSVTMVEAAGMLAIVIKAADRLANLRTMKELDDSRIDKKIRETEKFFIPLFERAAAEAADPIAPLVAKLLEKIQIEMRFLKNREKGFSHTQG